MFCPKCGTQSDAAKFCRLCGTNLTVVSNVISGPGSPHIVQKGRSALGIFYEDSISNLRGDLNGHSAVSVFGSVTIDLTAAPMRLGETKISVCSVFGGIDVLVPDGVGVRVTGLSLFADIRVRGQKIRRTPINFNEYVTPGYNQATHRLHIDGVAIFSGIKIRR